MIKTLQIKNYAIIESLEIRFSKGLTIITGETGAGKSILLGALGLIMGKRAESKTLYDATQKCVVEAVFDVGMYPNLKGFFDENELDYDRETVIRREITPSGKSRAFVNDTPIHLKLLQQLTSSLIDLHQQFDTQDINDVSFQLQMVDALAQNGDLIEAYGEEYRYIQKQKRQLQKLLQQSEQAAKETDFLNFQLKELEQVELLSGEQEELETELASLTNAEAIKSKLAEAFRYLVDSEHSVLGQLENIAISLNSIREFHPQLEPLLEKYDGLVLELQEVANEFENIGESTEHNPERTLEVNDRLNAIYRLQKKHSVNTIEELLAIQEEVSQQLQSFTDISDQIERLEKEITKLEKSLRQTASQLSQNRQSVVGKLEDLVHQKLAQLSMQHARLKIDIQPVEELTPTGTDQVEFLFASNKGSRYLSVKDSASGGEMSRLTLCVKSLVASSIPLPTLIFDEIDAGVSGNVALKMGGILRELSNEHQVVVITHSPQVASKADAHYFVYKKVDEERTRTKVRALNSDERVRAIATMLSTNPPSESAIENAKELLAMS